MNRPGFVTGFRFEGAILAQAASRLPGRPLPLLFAAGANAARAETAAHALVSQGAETLVSFGLSGGLDPSLAPGTVVLGDAVLAPDGEKTHADGALFTELSKAIGPASVAGLIAGSDRALTTLGEKAALFHDTGALAVDMESHGVARAARNLGVPFLVIRAVNDPSWRALPSSALAGIAADGRLRRGAVLWAALGRPREWWGLAQLAFDKRAAMRRLRRISPGFLGVLGL